MKKKNMRIVIKVGTNLITAKKNRLDKAGISQIVEQIARLWDSGNEVLLVTSGAIGAGMGLLKINERPQSLEKLQACAAVGQGQLMKIYDSFFKKTGRVTAQLLVTRDDLADRKRYLNAKNTLLTLLDEGVVPIINENDTVSTEEIKFGDNDRLSSLIANLVEADMLIMLTDVDGLFKCDPSGKRFSLCVKEITEVTDEVRRLALKTKTKLGMGGMSTKIDAGRLCIESGICCVVANGRKKNILIDIVNGKPEGTTFRPRGVKIASRKHWIAHSSKLMGGVTLDDGAREALVVKKKSLLASGIVDVRGNFAAGEVISVLDKNNKEFARGLTNYSSSEIKKIKGLKTSQIKDALGYKSSDEVLHRDNLVML